MYGNIRMYLEHHWCGGGREVEALEEMLVRVVAGSIALDHDSLGRALLTNQQDRLQAHQTETHHDRSNTSIKTL